MVPAHQPRELSNSKSTQPNSETLWVTLYILVSKKGYSAFHTGVPTPPFTAMSLLHRSWPPPGPRGGSERWCEGSWSPSWRRRCMVDPGGAKESDDVYAALGIRFLLVTYMNCKGVV